VSACTLIVISYKASVTKLHSFSSVPPVPTLSSQYLTDTSQRRRRVTGVTDRDIMLWNVKCCRCQIFRFLYFLFFMDHEWTANGPQMDYKCTMTMNREWTANGPQLCPWLDRNFVRDWTTNGPRLCPWMDCDGPRIGSYFWNDMTATVIWNKLQQEFNPRMREFTCEFPQWNFNELSSPVSNCPYY